MPLLFGRFKPRSSPPPLSPRESLVPESLQHQPPPAYTINDDPEVTMGHRHSRVAGSSSTSTSRMTTYQGTQSTPHKGNAYVQTRNADVWSPPPYTPQAPAPAAHTPGSTASFSSSTGDSPYAFLREFDTIFVVDDSSSMLGARWKEAEEALAAIAPICTRYDQDGIDIYFLNHRREATATSTGAYHNITTAADVQEIFNSVRPRGPTPYGKRLLQILTPYLRRVEKMAAATDEDGNLRDPARFVKPLNVIAITDGVFTDDAESVIVEVAKRLDACRAVPWQVGVQFFQIGDDEGARRYLEDLDDELGHMAQEDNLRDIVDTVPWKGSHGQTLSAEGILKCTMGAVHKKYDKRKAF
ncbi:uncharacterized protein P174DRAFT_450718 [Aspergillus novofumigatus IBT 16806]|uniref:VWFA domain-containing protein n=1 Tax=Aspergillus novofumigatus (strain IBT 16806) TaxID=1392255 RepID=A0A2I1C817_ASPN1|nr:uncharacterized protein P174DRAFT_450718 [Aspergillus novofumigatus IBT 16806]PKX93760.1 hypothetical protein P174DRAFT_450718 [Aspergillus novofumigatus IBT 16806]